MYSTVECRKIISGRTWNKKIHWQMVDAWNCNKQGYLLQCTSATTEVDIIIMSSVCVCVCVCV